MREVGKAAPGVLTCGKWDYEDEDRAFYLDGSADVMLKLNGDWVTDEERMAFAAQVLKALANGAQSGGGHSEDELRAAILALPAYGWDEAVRNGRIVCNGARMKRVADVLGIELHEFPPDFYDGDGKLKPEYVERLREGSSE